MSEQNKPPVTVEYRAIIKALEKELALEVTIPGDSLTVFKKRLSQAKFHAGVEGRLIFDAKLVNSNWVVSIGLIPKAAKAAEIISMNIKGGF